MIKVGELRAPTAISPMRSPQGQLSKRRKAFPDSRQASGRQRDAIVSDGCDSTGTRTGDLPFFHRVRAIHNHRIGVRRSSRGQRSLGGHLDFSVNSSRGREISLAGDESLQDPHCASPLHDSTSPHESHPKQSHTAQVLSGIWLAVFVAHKQAEHYKHTHLIGLTAELSAVVRCDGAAISEPRSPFRGATGIERSNARIGTYRAVALCASQEYIHRFSVEALQINAPPHHAGLSPLKAFVAARHT